MTGHEKDVIALLSITWGVWAGGPLTWILVRLWRRKRRAKKEQLAGLTTVGNESTPTYMDHRQQDVHYLFHTLWAKAVGTENYNKNEWKQMSNYLYALLAEPEASQKIAEALLEVPPPTRFERDPVL